MYSVFKVVHEEVHIPATVGPESDNEGDLAIHKKRVGIL
jgi:hypothetical protein